jgi:hypothetical protein
MTAKPLLMLINGPNVSWKVLKITLDGPRHAVKTRC